MQKWKNNEGNGAEWRNRRIMKKMVRKGETKE